MTDEWTRAEKRKAQSEQAKAIMDFVSMLSDKINELEKENAELKEHHKSVCETLTNTHRSLREQLTKAIELLKETQGYIENNDDVLYDEIEQFIREI